MPSYLLTVRLVRQQEFCQGKSVCLTHLRDLSYVRNSAVAKKLLSLIDAGTGRKDFGSITECTSEG